LSAALHRLPWWCLEDSLLRGPHCQCLQKRDCHYCALWLLWMWPHDRYDALALAIQNYPLSYQPAQLVRFPLNVSCLCARHPLEGPAGGDLLIFWLLAEAH